jgi:catechol 2,3-dioxygenase-like lactoylglutathione lyase family enzyme
VTQPGLLLHHVGCLVENLEKAAAFYVSALCAEVTREAVYISGQKVRVLFLTIGGATLELVQPDKDNASLQQRLRSGASFYHLGYLCPDLERAGAALLEGGAKEIGRFSSEAFEGRTCIFYFTRERHMIELIQM